MNSPMMVPMPPTPDVRYDRITRVAAMSLISPIALLAMIDADEDAVRLISVFGADAPSAHCMIGELGTGLLRNALAIDDARLDTRFHDTVAGCSIGAVAYCNAPLFDADGELIGSLCVIDTRPRQWSSGEIDTLQDVAALAMDLMQGVSVTVRAKEAEPPGFFSHMPAWFARHTTLGLLAVDPQGRCLWGNATCEQMLAVPMASMQGRALTELLQPLQPDDAIDMAVAGVLQSGKAQLLEVRLPSSSYGCYEPERFMSVNIAPIEYEGDVIGAGVILTEISDRRKSERDLRLAEERLALACEAANVGLWFWDLRTNQLEWTERCRGIFGLSGAEPVNYEIFSDLVHPEDKSLMELAMEEALAGQTPDYHATFRVLLADNRMRWIEARGRVFTNNRGEPAHFMGAMVDVTALKQNETTLQARSDALLTLNDNLAELVEARTAELQQLSQSLIELAEKEKAELARELHDELGALLTVAHMEVAGALRRLTDKNSDLYQQLTRARETIQETTMLKRRVVEGLRPSLLESLGLAEALRALVEQYKKAAAHIVCRAEIPEEIPDLRPDLSIALYRIAQESLTNIAKYAGASEVFIRIEHAGGNVILEVADNGLGLPEDFRERATAHGISGMQQRAAHFKGVFSIMNRTDGPGTRVTAVIPCSG
ncbi:MAG TPA: PAS domain-containing protein [Rhodocyclaceae bacterium]|nr:PAS domain-containing protein [Rhodocyclaceae bacterium]